MTRPAWLLQPIAHRGLHDRAAGIIENSPSAFAAAIAHGYAIETDLREAACGTPMLFHDARLERLTGAKGLLAAHDAGALRALKLRGMDEHIPSLADLLAQAAGRVPLFLEVKTGGQGAPRFARRIAEELRGYDGPVAILSFDPWLLRTFRALAPQLPRGLGARRVRRDNAYGAGPLRRFALTHLLYAPLARPAFIAYNIADLPALAPWLARKLFGLPVIAWTVRSEQDRARAELYADAIIFEHLRPPPGPR